MKYLVIILVCFSVGIGTLKAQQFSEKALNDTFLNEDETVISLSEVLETYKGKTILIDIWATWCRDCIVGLPKLEALQQNFPDVAYVFISFDRSVENWKMGIEKYNLNGHHYFSKNGWKSNFAAAIDLDWIPRYIVVNSSGEISLYKAIKADDPKLIKVLQE